MSGTAALISAMRRQHQAAVGALPLFAAERRATRPVAAHRCSTTRISTGPSISRTDLHQCGHRSPVGGVGGERPHLGTGLGAQLRGGLLDPVLRAAGHSHARALVGPATRRPPGRCPCWRPSRAPRDLRDAEVQRVSGAGQASGGTVNGEISYALPGTPPMAITRAPSSPVTILRFSPGPTRAKVPGASSCSSSPT